MTERSAEVKTLESVRELIDSLENAKELTHELLEALDELDGRLGKSARGTPTALAQEKREKTILQRVVERAAEHERKREQSS
jgi:hypothetical protein